MTSTSLDNDPGRRNMFIEWVISGEDLITQVAAGVLRSSSDGRVRLRLRLRLRYIPSMDGK